MGRSYLDSHEGRIRDLAASGMTHGQIARRLWDEGVRGERFEVPADSVELLLRRWTIKNGVQVTLKPMKTDHERNAEIFQRRWRDGRVYREIAAEFGLSVDRTRQIVFKEIRRRSEEAGLSSSCDFGFEFGRDWYRFVSDEEYKSAEHECFRWRGMHVLATYLPRPSGRELVAVFRYV